MEVGEIAEVTGIATALVSWPYQATRKLATQRYAVYDGVLIWRGKTFCLAEPCWRENSQDRGPSEALAVLS